MNELLKLYAAFEAGKGPKGRAFVTGGAVRDMLTAREVSDADIAFKGDALGRGRAFARHAGGRFVLLDERFGTARVTKGGLYIDISRLRGEKIEEDLSERDITINAMALPVSAVLKKKEAALRHLIDPFGGLRDLKAKKVRMISEENLGADPVRLLRVYRFSASLGFRIEGRTREALRGLAPLLASSAPERKMQELRQMLGQRGSFGALRAMERDGMLEVLFPSLGKRAASNAASVGRLERLIAGDEIFARLSEDSRKTVGMKLAVLLWGLGPSSVIRLSRGLRMSNSERDYVVMIHDGLKGLSVLSGKRPSGPAMVRLIRRLGDEFLGLSLAASAVGGPDARRISKGMALFYEHEVRPRMKAPRLLTGDDLMREFSLSPSPLIGKMLARIEEMSLLGRLGSKEEALKAARRLLGSRTDT